MIQIQTTEGTREWPANTTRAAIVGDRITLPEGSEATGSPGITVDGRDVTVNAAGAHSLTVDGQSYALFAWSPNALTWLSALTSSPHTTEAGASPRAILCSLSRDAAVGVDARHRAVTEADTPHGGLAGVPLHRFGLARRRTDPGAV